MTSVEHSDISRQTGMALRTSLQVALQVAEQLTRRREQRLRAAAADNEQRARTLSARLDAERRSVDARLHSARRESWWSTATDAQITATARLAHTWKQQSQVADDVARALPDRLQRHRRIDLRLPDTAEAALIAAIVERDLATRAEYERISESYTERGFDVRTETPHGTDYIPARHLATEFGAEFGAATVDSAVIDAHPQAWVVHMRTGPDGGPDPQFYCTDPDAAGVHRRGPERADLWDEQWLDSATEPQLRSLRETLTASASAAGIERLDREVADRRGIDLTRAPDDIGRDIDTALPWAEKNIPADHARYKDGTHKTRAAAAEHIHTAFDTHHAQQWANDRAPALAVEYGAAAKASDRNTYLSVRGKMIDAWNDAGRPDVRDVVDPAASTTDVAGAVPLQKLGYDTPQRRQRDVDALTAAGVDAETITAHVLADTATATPLDANATRTAPTAPTASKGVHSPHTEQSTDRGSR